jgi:hypothetical protein
MFPDEGSRLVYAISGTAFRSSVATQMKVYSDSGATTLADIQTTGGATISGSVITVDSGSQLPLFKGPDDASDTLYVKKADGTGSVSAIYARVDDRLDVIVNEDPLNVMDARFGAAGNGTTDDAAAIQAAIDLAQTANTPSEVILPGRKFSLASPLTLPPGVTLRGLSPGANGLAGTLLAPTAAVTTAALRTSAVVNGPTDFWHRGGLFDLRLDCSAMTAPTADGIELYLMGELAIADRVMVIQAPRHGLYVHGEGTPVKLGYLSLHSNGRSGSGSGLFMSGSHYTGNYIEYVGGDNNGTALIELEFLGRSTTFIAAFKAERHSASGSPGNPTVIKINRGDGGTVVIGGGRVYKSPAAADGSHIILNTQSGGAVARVIVAGAIEYDDTATYTYDYYEDNGGIISAVPFGRLRGRSLTLARDGHTAMPATGGVAYELLRGVVGLVPYLIAAQTNGESFHRFRVDHSGKLEWSDGTVAPGSTSGLNLYRNNAVLTTDGKLTAVGGLGVGNSSPATMLGTVTKKIEVFASNGTSLGYVPVYDAIT